MTDNLDNLVQKAEDDIHRTVVRKPKGDSKTRLPRLSFPMATWLLATLLVAFQFEQIVSTISYPADSQIEEDLGSLLSRTSDSLQAYQKLNGVLPPLLPNPPIRGLVKYERHSDLSFTLKATIGDVTMVMRSSSTAPYREDEEKT
ncbi:MAG: hypothetical protein JJ934_01280 [Pseudomonadales bacterium]|nr:hypothetical protein [Pseudomonadales bacterium]MBO6655491.1 hypothetical protein [Pseudomonadales bacterium]